jgi:DNA-binding IclR family transcriptional regulator
MVQRMVNGVDAVERALAILEAFKTGARVLSLKELAELTKLNKATILRLMVSLEKFHYVTRLGEGRFSLGPAPIQLGGVYQRSFRLSDHVVPVLQHIVALTGETAAYFIREKDQRVCLFMVESPNTLRSHLREGDVRPLRPGGTGVVLQAFSGEKGAEFERTRKTFLALNIGERHPEIASIAAPVFRLGGELAAALSLSGPISHFEEPALTSYSAVVLEGAAAITNTLGGDPSGLQAARDRLNATALAAKSSARKKAKAGVRSRA